MAKEYIERKKLLKTLNEAHELEQSISRTYKEGYNDAAAICWDAPVADVAPVAHGEWISIADGDMMECPVCGSTYDGEGDAEDFIKRNSFCRECGAKMDGVKGK